MIAHLFLPTWCVFHICFISLSSLTLSHKMKNKKQTECLSDSRLLNVMKWRAKCFSLISANKRSLIIFSQNEREVITTNSFCSYYTRQHLQLFSIYFLHFRIVLHSLMSFDKTLFVQGPLLASSPRKWSRLLSLHEENETV